jgi:hypothetical protein
MVQGRLLIVETQFGIKIKPYDFYFYFFNKKIENVITLNLCLSFISSFPLSLSHFRFFFFFSLFDFFYTSFTPFKNIHSSWIKKKGNSLKFYTEFHISLVQ